MTLFWYYVLSIITSVIMLSILYWLSSKVTVHQIINITYLIAILDTSVFIWLRRFVV